MLTKKKEPDTSNEARFVGGAAIPPGPWAPQSEGADRLRELENAKRGGGGRTKEELRAIDGQIEEVQGVMSVKRAEQREALRQAADALHAERRRCLGLWDSWVKALVVAWGVSGDVAASNCRQIELAAAARAAARELGEKFDGGDPNPPFRTGTTTSGLVDARGIWELVGKAAVAAALENNQERTTIGSIVAEAGG